MHPLRRVLGFINDLFKSLQFGHATSAILVREAPDPHEQPRRHPDHPRRSLRQIPDRRTLLQIPDRLLLRARGRRLKDPGGGVMGRAIEYRIKPKTEKKFTVNLLRL